MTYLTLNLSMDRGSQNLDSLPISINPSSFRLRLMATFTFCSNGPDTLALLVSAAKSLKLCSLTNSILTVYEVFDCESTPVAIMRYWTCMGDQMFLPRSQTQTYTLYSVFLETLPDDFLLGGSHHIIPNATCILLDGWIKVEGIYIDHLVFINEGDLEGTMNIENTGK